MDVQLDPRFEKPKGWRRGTFTNADDATLSYGYIKAEDPRGTAICCTGFNEFVDKYFEMVRELTSRGLNVWFMDWWGQGRSDRYPEIDNPEAGHKRDMADDMRDFHHFATQIVKPLKKAPVLCFAHSMGGHIALRTCHDYPDLFDYTILTAPMQGICLNPVLKPVARLLAQTMPQTLSVPRHNSWGMEPPPLNKDLLSHDEARRRVYFIYKHLEPQVCLGAPTFGWLNAAFRSMDLVMQEDYLKQIHTPIFIQISMADKVVDVEAAQWTVKHLPDCDHVDVPGARHEIWMEKDEYRNTFLSALDRYLITRVFRD